MKDTRCPAHRYGVPVAVTERYTGGPRCGRRIPNTDPPVWCWLQPGHGGGCE